MASRITQAYTTVGTYGVGNINSFKIRTVPNGAIVSTADIHNFTIGELGFNANGERTVVQLSAKANRGVLVASPERRFAEGEVLADFYNAVGEPARAIILDLGVRFETSSFSKNTGVTTLSNGMVAHFDVTTKKFIISASGSPHTDYAGSANQFVVVATDTDLTAIDGQAVVRLEVTK